MWESQRHTTLRAFMACYRDSFTFLPPFRRVVSCYPYSPIPFLYPHDILTRSTSCIGHCCPCLDDFSQSLLDIPHYYSLYIYFTRFLYLSSCGICSCFSRVHGMGLITFLCILLLLVFSISTLFISLRSIILASGYSGCPIFLLFDLYFRATLLVISTPRYLKLIVH
jgi:hypothetical protein